MAGTRTIVCVLLLALVSAGTAVAHTDEGTRGEPARGEDGPAVLHLAGTDPRGSYHNFTTRTPQSDQAVHVEPCLVTQDGTATWCWQMDRAPRPWTLHAGARVHAVVHLDLLDRVPAGLLDTNSPEQSGSLRLDVVLTRGTADEVAWGHVHIDPPALSGRSASVQHVVLEVPEDAHWNTARGDSPAVELQLRLSGLVRRDLPPMVATGAVVADSRLVIPGFPVAAFAEWEQKEAAAKECRERLLAQEPCAPDDGDDVGGDDRFVNEAPFPPPVVVALTVLALVAGLRATRRRRRK